MKPSLILSIFILIPNLIKTQLMIYTSSSSPVKKSRYSLIGHRPFVIRLTTHHKTEFYSITDIIIRQVGLIVLFTVDIKLLHIQVLWRPVVRCHFDVFSITHPDRNSLCAWRTDIINIAGRSHRIETDAVEHIPRRHLSAIVVTTQCIRCISVETIDNGTYPLLTFPRFFQVVVEVSDMMARFISMPIGSDTSLYIMCSGDIIRHGSFPCQ